MRGIGRQSAGAVVLLLLAAAGLGQWAHPSLKVGGRFYALSPPWEWGFDSHDVGPKNLDRPYAGWAYVYRGTWISRVEHLGVIKRLTPVKGSLLRPED